MIFSGWTSFTCSNPAFVFVPPPPVLSYHVGAPELWQLLHENGDPHIIFNNRSKSAKVSASRKIELQMTTNLKLEDDIGVPFEICLKIMS